MRKFRSGGSNRMLYCIGCGKQIHISALSCPRCGAINDGKGASVTFASDQSRLFVFLACLFFGLLGGHRFWIGRTQSAAIQFFTIGGLTIWWAIDLVLIALGLFRDRRGRRISRWVFTAPD